MEPPSQINMPTFTSCPPGISGDLSAKADEFSKRFDKSRRVIFSREKLTSIVWNKGAFIEKVRSKPLNLFLHGALEDIIGYDVPRFLSGYIYNKPVQWANVFDATGRRRFDAALLMQERKTRYYGIIVFRHEIRDYSSQLSNLDFGI